MDQIRSFAFHNKDSIKCELEGLKGTGAGKWILDLTDTAIFHQLAEWGQRFEQIEVYCDPSKPLDHYKEMFNVMINREDKKYIELNGDSSPLTFNMSKEIQLGDSVDLHGIQIADIFAGATSYVMSNSGSNDRYVEQWKEYILPNFMKQSVLPDTSHLDLNEMNTIRNVLILEELVDRSKRKHSLLEGMPEFVIGLTEYLHQKEMIN